MAAEGRRNRNVKSVDTDHADLNGKTARITATAKCFVKTYVG